jgi:hypothetical protein
MGAGSHSGATEKCRERRHGDSTLLAARAPSRVGRCSSFVRNAGRARMGGSTL